MKRVLLLAAVAGALSVAAHAKPVRLSDAELDHIYAGTDFNVTNVIANQPGAAPNTDPNLVNPWGLAASPTGPLWAADNRSGKATAYSAAGVPIPPVIDIPAPGGGAGTPTGAAFNPGAGFTISSRGLSGDSTFLFATQNGTIAGWSPVVSPGQAVLAVNQAAQGAQFTGLTIAQRDGSNFLFVADFAHNLVKVFNTQFQQVGSFTDEWVTSGFAPFNVQNINGDLVVAFARNGPGATDGLGNGVIDVFSTSGHLLRRIASGGTLNSPWGLAIAPGNFGSFANALLVGNSADGRINAFDFGTGRALGQLTGAVGPLGIDGLWSLTSGQAGGGTVTFSAGPNGNRNGLVGTITPMSAVPASQNSAMAAVRAGATASTIMAPGR